MTGRVTMLGISRWAKPNGSYRTVQHFFAKDAYCVSINCSITKVYFNDPSGVILIAGDATTVIQSQATTLRRDKKNRIIAHALSFQVTMWKRRNALMHPILAAGAA